MPILSLLLLILFTCQAAYAYTVVLASGKRIEGTLIDDQQNTIVLKDSQGVLLSFKKSILDLHAMSAANRVSQQSEMPSTPVQQRSRPSIVEIAEQTRKKRTGKSKMVHLEDVDDSAPLSILGSTDEPALKPDRSATAVQEGPWRTRLWSLKKEINRLREKLIAAESSCEQAKDRQYANRTTPSRKPVNLMATYEETSECRKMTEIAAQLQEAESRWENAREEARRAGVSWQTLE